MFEQRKKPPAKPAGTGGAADAGQMVKRPKGPSIDEALNSIEVANAPPNDMGDLFTEVFGKENTCGCF